MIKLLGMALIILSTTMAGQSLSASLSKKVTTLENVIGLHRYLRDRLRYLQPGIMQLIDSAASSQEFGGLDFLKECRSRMQDGGDFSECWKAAVKNDAAALGKEAVPVIASLAEVLGKTDLESQLAAIDYGASLLVKRLEAEREYLKKHKSLYSTLGVLLGALIVVVIA